MTLSLVFFIVWAVAVLLAVWALNFAQRFGLRLPRVALRPLHKAKLPRVAVIVPIKGVDDDTTTNVRLLLEQEYPDYRIIFAVESNDDPVLPLLERLAIDDSRLEIVVAGLATSRGQKVHNQLAAIERTTDTDELLAFMDADARPGPHWLRALVTPLTFVQQNIGATTGYRFYIPMTAHTANKIVSILNAQIAALLGPYRHNFAWGGSMAIRRRDFFAFGLDKMWQHTSPTISSSPTASKKWPSAKFSSFPNASSPPKPTSIGPPSLNSPSANTASPKSARRPSG